MKNNFFVKKKREIFCKNCNKYGHMLKTCNEPIVSCGLISFCLFNKKNNKILNYSNLNKNNINFDNIEIKYLIAQRKHTLGFIEFARGNYYISDYYSIIILFKQMIQEEIDLICNNNFDTIWNSIWNNAYESKSNIYFLSKNKFNYLKKNNTYINLVDISKTKPLWKDKEWGFPKGRPNNYESNLECSIREYEEETYHTSKIYNILLNYEPYEEILNGTNGYKYKHIYYVSNIINTINEKIKYSNEIECLKLIKYSEISKYIRPYHKDKLNIIENLNAKLLNNIKFKLNKNIK